MAMMTEGGALGQAAEGLTRMLPPLIALLGPTALVGAVATDGAPSALLALTLLWGGGGSALAWLWTRSRSLPWQ